MPATTAAPSIAARQRAALVASVVIAGAPVCEIQPHDIAGYFRLARERFDFGLGERQAGQQRAAKVERARGVARLVELAAAAGERHEQPASVPELPVMHRVIREIGLERRQYFPFGSQPVEAGTLRFVGPRLDPGILPTSAEQREVDAHLDRNQIAEVRLAPAIHGAYPPVGALLGPGDADLGLRRPCLRIERPQPRQRIGEGDLRLANIGDPVSYFRVEKMKFAGKRPKLDKTTVIYNPRITITNIPLAAYEYVVNGKPALEWVMERQCVSTDPASGIVNDANAYANETVGDPRYPFDLFCRIITVSLETMKIVKALPTLDIRDAGA